MSKCDPFRSKTEFKGKKQKRSQGSSHYRPKAPTELTPLPPLRDAPANEQQELFIKKLQQCCVVFDFSDALTDTQSKEIKRTCLSELVEYVTVTRGVLNENTYQDIIRMVRISFPSPFKAIVALKQILACALFFFVDCLQYISYFTSIW